jgi:DNA-binding NtrC family response regulator
MDDLPLLAEHFFRQLKEKYNKNNLRMGERALESLRKYHWPGNVRELQHTIERAVIMSEGNVLQPQDLGIKQKSSQPGRGSLNVESMERNAIVEAINQSKGNMSQAAEKLGLSRSTLYRKIKKYDI